MSILEKRAPGDPRPELLEVDGDIVAAGVRCTRSSCAYATVLPTRRCPVCGHAVESRRMGPEGTVWSHTVVRIPFNGRPAPYRIAYVDLDGGARMLVHLEHPDTRPVRIGSRLRLAGVTEQGDVWGEIL